MKHEKRLYQEPTMDIIKITTIAFLAESAGQGDSPDEGGNSREYYYTDPFHYLYDINE